MLFCLQISCNMNYQNRNLIYQYINLTPHSISYYGLIFFSGFPTGVENMRETVTPIGEALQNLIGDFSQYMGRGMGGLKMLLKNTWEGVHLIVKLSAKSLQACKFTKNELHTYFSRILARF